MTVLHQRLTSGIYSPTTQTFILGIVLFFCVGLNNAVLGLGAGGSRPENIASVDRINYVVSFTIIGFSLLGGLITNKLGPQCTIVLASAGYPLFIGGLWYEPPCFRNRFLRCPSGHWTGEETKHSHTLRRRFTEPVLLACIQLPVCPCKAAFIRPIPEMNKCPRFHNSELLTRTQSRKICSGPMDLHCAWVNISSRCDDHLLGISILVNSH
jgi:hypothetical protein